MSTGFNFGGASSGGGSGIFGQTSTTNQNSSTPATTAPSNPFAAATLSQQSSPFGGSASQPPPVSLFGSLNTTAGGQKPLSFGSTPTSSQTSGTSTPSIFSASIGTTGGGQTGNMFGGGGNTTGGSLAFGPSGLSFGKKPDEKKELSATAESSQQKPQNPFAVATSPFSPSPFGSKATSTAPVGSTTPATTKPGGLFNFPNSTTPAGPPPAGITAGTGTSIFSSQKPAGSADPPPPAGADMFGASLWGGTQASKPATSESITPTTSTTATGKLTFGLAPAASTKAPSIFGTTATSSISNPTTTATSIFSPPTTTAPASSTAAASTATQASSIFGTLTTTSAISAPAASTAPKSLSMFEALASAPAISAPAASTAPKTSSIFGGLGTTTTSSPSSAPGQTPSFLTDFGKPSTTTAPTSTSASDTTKATANPSLLAPKTTAEATSGTTTTATAGADGSGAAGTTLGLGASTAGPAPQLSRLKNKTMDEIITRWATDLSTYQKEFQDQAAKAAAWDRLLVENGEKIQKLYTSTFEAERASAEVERQLASVESQQDELAAWLDHYEREVDQMFTKQVGTGESLQGPDQERERTYKLAEKLADRLDEMGKDLTNMIQEINSASATLTKTSKPDDPLSQIVRVLNGHLSQLQWIDQNAALLRGKVEAARKTGQSLAANGNGGENDAVDDFYRSYMGRR